MPPKEKAGYAVIGVIVVASLYLLGARQLKQPSEIQIINPATSTPSSLESSSLLSVPAAKTTANSIVVHVTGSVANPGVYEFTSEDRVQDAIKRAGGPKQGANLDDLNLAAKLVDGTQLKVENRGATSPSSNESSPYAPGSAATSSYSHSKSGGSSHSTTLAPASISLNTASASQLDRLPGVGPATAAKIIEYRHQSGGFSSVAELLKVKGIGQKKFAAMKKYLKL